MQSSQDYPEVQSRFPSLALTTLAGIYFILLGCIIAYIWLVAQDRFVSVASFKISRQNPSSGEIGFAGLALPGIADSGSADSQVATGFVNSADMLLGLEKEFDLRKHYALPKTDYFFRLKADASIEDRLDFYRGRIYAQYDKETGLTMLNVDTFDSKLSQEISIFVLKETEKFINSLNQAVADQQLTFAQNEAARSEGNVSQVINELLELQNANNLVDPDQVISANLQTVQELKMDKLRNETLLASIERDSPGSPRIDTLKSQLRSLNEQIAIESAKLSGPEKDRLNQVLARFKELELKLQFANQMRVSAIAIVEKTRVDAAAQSRFLSVIQSPFLPEEALYPQRPYATVTIAILGVLLFMTLRVMVLSVYERVN